MGKLNLRSYQWTSPPAVAFTAFADAWPRAIETEIGAALCAIGARKDFDFDLNVTRIHENSKS